MEKLLESKIPTMIYYKIPLHLQQAFKKFKYSVGDFPISEKVANKIFSIPMHPYLDIDKQNRVIEVLNS